MATPLNVTELFYSLQGEGYRAGDPSIFIRLQGCSAKYACYEAGVRCDTEFESGRSIDVESLHDLLLKLSEKCGWIIWTGGEPLDQLTCDHIQYFKSAGYMQAIETSGAKPVSLDMREMLDWVVCSPKVAEHVLLRHFLGEYSRRGGEPVHVDELRYVRHAGQTIPEPVLKASKCYVSPHFDGSDLNEDNIRHCIKLCLANPQWSLSLQAHKLTRIL